MASAHGANNQLSTGTLEARDLSNRADYSASSVGISLGTGAAGLNGSGGFGQDSGHAASTTRSAIGQGTVTTDAQGQQALASVRRDQTSEQDGAQRITPIFDQRKVQAEVAAQVAITQEFGVQARTAIDGYMARQQEVLQQQVDKATSEADLSKLAAARKELVMEGRILNLLVAAVTGNIAQAALKEGLAAAADEMRQYTIADSRKFAGITDGVTVLSNDSGLSEGLDRDRSKTGGTRLDLDALCGTANQRCVTQSDPVTGAKILDDKGVPKLLLDEKGRVMFDTYKAKTTLAEFIASPAGKAMGGLTGGIQGAQGTLFGAPYAPGSWQDKLIEAFGGTHDVIGGTLSGLYDEQGNARRGQSPLENKLVNIWSAAAIVPSTPFAGAKLLPPNVWEAIAILLKGN